MANYFIGWDVGAWYCDNNAKSKDALVILNSKGEIIGKPWRANLSNLINTESCLEKFLEQLFTLCKASGMVDTDDQICLAIDAPLGFPVGFRKLLCKGEIYKLSELESSYSIDRNRHIYNPYLYRETERILYEKFGKVPLSPIQHMIGAQATKGIHFLNHFKLERISRGVWKNDNLKVIEAYPATVNNSLLALSVESAALLKLSQAKIEAGKLSPAKQDRFDAYKCAVVAKAFVEEKDSLIAPIGVIDEGEGWIWTFEN